MIDRVNGVVAEYQLQGYTENGVGTFGAIIGTVNVTGCFRTEAIRHTLTDRELALGDFSDGRFAWKLDSPVIFKTPIPMRGKQGLWEARI